MAKNSSWHPAAPHDVSTSSVLKRARPSRATPNLRTVPLAPTPPSKAEAEGDPDIALVRERTRHRLVFVGVAAYASVVPLAMAGLLLGRLSSAEVRELFASLNVSTIAMCAMTFYFGRPSR